MIYIERISDIELIRKLKASGAVLIRGTGQINEAAANLTKFVSTLDLNKIKPPTSLHIITGTGISHTRTNGINAISLASLGK